MYQKYQGELLLLAVTVLAAFGWLASKAAIAELPAAAFLAIRFLTAVLLFLPFAYGELRRLAWQDWARAVAVGLAFASNVFLWIQAITHSQYFGEGAFLMSLSMLLAPLLSWLLFGNRPARIFWVSLAMAVAGLYCLNMGKPLAQFSLASALYAGASVSAALYFVLNHQFTKNLPTLALASIQLLTAGVVCLGYSLLFETWQANVSAKTWLWVAISILFITNLRYFLQNLGQKRCAIGNAALIMILEPVWTVVLSVVWLGETLTWQKFLGGGLIVLALAVYRLPLQWLQRR